MRPLLLVDVDGVISLFGFDHTSPPGATPAVVDGIPHWLSHAAARNLTRLRNAFDCVWCTGWEERANEHLPHLLGLPGPFPYLRLDGPNSDHRHWKLGAIDTHAGATRPLAWIDDDLDHRCTEWAAARPGPTLLIRTDPAIGLVDHHTDELLAWAAALR